MTGETRTLTDELTGVVYPIYFGPEHLSLPGHDHHANHMSIREELQDGIGRALRLSRVQWTPDIFHFRRIPGSYHSFRGLEQGPEIPSSEDDKFRLTILYLAGVVPNLAFDFRSRNPKKYSIKQLSKKEHAFLSQPEITRPEKKFHPNGYNWQIRRRKLGKYIAEYALNQPGVEEVASDLEWKKVLNPHRGQQEELTSEIIKLAVDRVINPVIPVYESAKNEGMVSPDQPSIKDTLNELLPDQELIIHHDLIIESQLPRLAAAA